MPGQGVVTTGTKTGKTREVAVPPPVWDRLVVELPTEPWALAFPNCRGSVLTNHEYRYVFDGAVAAMQAESTAARARAREIAEVGEVLPVGSRGGELAVRAFPPHLYPSFPSDQTAAPKPTGSSPKDRTPNTLVWQRAS